MKSDCQRANRVRHCRVLAVLFGWAAMGVAGCEQPSVRVSLAESPFNPDQPDKYMVYPGDLLLVRFPTDPNLDQQVRIRSDGKITVPHVGDVVAAQRSPEEVAAEVKEKLSGVLRQPEVTVIVMEETGRRIYVGGQVQNPGAMALNPHQTLLQAVFEAGGVTGTAHKGDVLILRHRVGEATYVLEADLDRILARQEPDIRLEPYDIIHVPETIIAQVDRFVEQYVNLIIPRSVSFPFTGYLGTQRVRVVNQQRGNVAPVTITR